MMEMHSSSTNQMLLASLPSWVTFMGLFPIGFHICQMSKKNIKNYRLTVWLSFPDGHLTVTYYVGYGAV